MKLFLGKGIKILQYQDDTAREGGVWLVSLMQGADAEQFMEKRLLDKKKGYTSNLKYKWKEAF